MTEIKLKYQAVPSTTVQRLVDKLSKDKGDGWDHTIFSADKILKANYRYKGEIPWGPPYFSVRVTENHTGKTIWDGGDKIYGLPPTAFNSPFDKTGKYLGLIEWLDLKYGNESIKLIDLQTGEEIILSDRRSSYKFNFFPSSSLGLVVTEWKKDFQDSIFVSFDKEVVYLGKSVHHRNCLVVDTSLSDILMVCEQLGMPSIKLINVKTQEVLKQFDLHPNIFDAIGHSGEIPSGEVTSGSVDLGSLIIGSTSKLSVGDAEGNVWDSLIFDKENDCYYFGIMRASSWGQNDYYRGQEWLSIKI